jgi:hypothetical protein
MTGMEVFLIPVGADRFELYCEVPDEDASAAGPDHDRGFFRGLVRRFRDTLGHIERERYAREADVPPHPANLYERAKRASLRKVAETMAEQRLLWHMRRQTAAVAVHPADLTTADAERVVRTGLQADYEKHRFWLVVNVVLTLLSAALIVLPGPNVIGYYFVFRMVGHYFAMRGARQGLDHATWAYRPSDALTELRPLAPLDCAERRPLVEAIAEQLQLEHLRRFFDRVAAPGA